MKAWRPRFGNNHFGRSSYVADVLKPLRVHALHVHARHRARRPRAGGGDSAARRGGLVAQPRRAPAQPFRCAIGPAHTSLSNPLGVRISKVYGSNVPARRYGTEIGDLNDQGENTRGEMTADLSPLPAQAFLTPVAAYKRYGERWDNHRRARGEWPA